MLNGMQETSIMTAFVVLSFVFVPGAAAALLILSAVASAAAAGRPQPPVRSAMRARMSSGGPAMSAR